MSDNNDFDPSNIIESVITSVISHFFTQTKVGQKILEGLLIFAGITIVILMLSYFAETSSKESAAQSNLETYCHRAWLFYYRNGNKMPTSNTFLEQNKDYSYHQVATPWRNVVVIAALSKNSNLNNFSAIAFGPYTKDKYVCNICKSDNSSNKNTYPVEDSGGISCPRKFNSVKVIRG